MIVSMGQPYNSPYEGEHNQYVAYPLGGIMKVWRDWRISADTAWLKTLWPRMRQSLDYCIRQWDPDGRGRAHGAAPQHL